MRRRLWIALGLTALACTPNAALTPPSSDPGPPPGIASPSVGPPWRMKIHFIEIAGRPFPYPLARVAVQGRASWWLVDTGASQDVLALWLARELGLEVKPSAQRGEGHGGEEVRTFQAHAVTIAIGGWDPRQLDALLVVDLPRVFQQLELGGVLSPQALAGAEAVAILDLPAEELSLGPLDAALEPDRGVRLAGGNEAVCAVAGPSAGAVYVVRALVEGMPTRLIVDTGAARTDLLAQSGAARALGPRTVPGGASYTAGGRQASGRVDAVSLRVGDMSTVVDLGILAGGAGASCPRDGHLGLDVLRRCVLVLATDRFEGRCAP